jgi:apolipoprotein N-acyltransferase
MSDSTTEAGTEPESAPENALLSPKGRSRWIYAILSGILLGISQPLVIGAFSSRPLDPSGLSGLLCLVGLVPVLLLVRDAPKKEAYWLGFFACWVQFSIIVYWTVVAMTVFGKVPLVVSIAVLLLLTAAMAAYVAASFAVARFICIRHGLSFWWVFPICLTAVELLRNFGFYGGFPWGNVGYSLATVPLLVQGASLVGVHGLILFVGLFNTALVEILVARKNGQAFPKVPAGVALGLLALFLIYGGIRLSGYDLEGAEKIRVGLLQGNIEQGIKNKGAQHRSLILRKYHRLQDEAVKGGADVVVWPEASLPGWVKRDTVDLGEKGVLSKKEGALMPPSAIVGGIGYFELPKEPGDVKKRFGYHNTAFITGPDLKVRGRFDKTHLVPFGEYVPWPFKAVVKRIVPGMGRMRRGGKIEALPLAVKGKDIPVGTTICYEGVFPEISWRFARVGAQLLFNVTNDAWYGVSSATYQHLNMYILRSVETGRATARATNTGASAWVDGRGGVHELSPLYKDHLILADVPLHDEKTLYVMLGEWVSVPCLLFALLAWILGLVGRDVFKRPRHGVEWILGAGGFGLAGMAVLGYYAHPGALGDESLNTQAVAATVAGLIIGSAAWSGVPWGRKAVMWIGGLCAVLNLVAVGFGAFYALPVVALGVAVYLAAKKRPLAYGKMAPDDGATKSEEP